MCGIAGVIAWSDRDRTSRQTLERMSAAIAHRGPDGSGLWTNHEAQATPDRPQAALAHRRLAIIDLDPRADQPFTDGQGRWIVFNGEIYNYRERRQELRGLDSSYEWRTECDTEVLLRAYAHWGCDCLARLNGMYAFAIWDENAKQLFLARDRMGQKPMYYALAQDRPDGFGAIAFASELGALQSVDWLDMQPDMGHVADYLSLGYFPLDTTIYRQIRKLPPASWMKIHKARIESGRYFVAAHQELLDLPPLPLAGEGRGEGQMATSALRASPAAPGWNKTHASRTRELVRLAVRRQMVADVPVGCFLSGGVDSSIIAACMKAAAQPGQPVLTFSIGFDDPRYDETHYAAQVARHLGTEHRQFIVKPDAAADLPKLAAVFGQPFGDSSALPTHYLARETRACVKAALSGDGGDELFGGYDRYRAMLIGQRLRRLASPLPWMLLAPLTRKLGGGHPKSRIARLSRFMESLGRSPGRRYQHYMHIFDPPLARRLLGLEHAAHDDLLADMHRTAMRDLDAVQAALQVDRATYLPDDLLAKVDHCSMLHALEVRSPFMDHELVAFAATLSTRQLLGGGGKRMLREAFAADLPEFVFKRPKMGFAVPIGEWFRGELRPMLRDHLFAQGSFARRHFSMPVVENLVDQHEQQRIDHSQRLYALLMLELWWTARHGPSS